MLTQIKSFDEVTEDEQVRERDNAATVLEAQEPPKFGGGGDPKRLAAFYRREASAIRARARKALL